MSFRDRLTDKILLFDGSKGFLIMQKGLAPGDIPDAWNLVNADAVYDIHKTYVDAGSDIIQTNTLQSSRYHLEARGLYDRLAAINSAGVALAKKAAGGKAMTAASISPLGKVMAPFGDISYEEAYEAFFEQIKVLLEAGVDILHFETFTDLSELRIAAIAAKELCGKAPVIATVSIENIGRTVMGDSADCAAVILSSLGVECAGANCGLPPREMLSKFAPFSRFNAPLCSKPNAGAPTVSEGVVNYGATAEEFYETAFGFARLGARLIGGCCGSGPEHIRMLKKAVDEMNADRAYDYSNVFADGGAASGQDDSVWLCTHNRKTVFLREELAAYANEARPMASSDKSAMPGPPVYTESADGKILTVDLSGMCCSGGDRIENGGALNDVIVDILSAASDSEAEATVFRLFAGGKGKSTGGEGKGARGEGKSAGEVLRAIAENARANHNKPIIFHTDEAAGLNDALKRYCGVPAILVEAAFEESVRAGVAGTKPAFVRIG